MRTPANNSGYNITYLYQVLEPCIKQCFKFKEAGPLVQEGANILYLLLDCEPPECNLASIAPSPLNLANQLHAATFLKYFNNLIRYKMMYTALLSALLSYLARIVHIH